jgi:hypothetical protein
VAEDICGYVGWMPHEAHFVEDRDGSFYCEGFPYPEREFD